MASSNNPKKNNPFTGGKLINQDFQKIIDNITDFIVLCDKNFNIISSNRSARIILGGGRAIEGFHCYEKFRGKQEPCEDCLIPKTIMSDFIVSLETYDKRFGEYFEERAYPVTSEEGEFEGFVLVGRNLSRVRALGDKSAQEKISSGIAHDFNNMLTNILGRVQLMKKTITDPLVIKNLKIIEIATLDGAATLKKMQDFARQRVDEVFESINLKQLIEEVVALTHPKLTKVAEDRGIIIEPVTYLMDEIYIMGNALDLRRAFTNIIFNAMDAMPYGGVLSIKSEVEDWKAIIRFTDTGIGMTPETIERIFDPFFSTKGEDGSGLGMTEVSGVITRHNGWMDIESEVGKGTKIIVYIPTTEKTTKEFVAPKTTAFTKGRILAIDDEEYVLEVIEELLAEFGHEVSATTSAENALERFRKEKYDIVITDLGMPEMSGWELAKEIKKIDPTTPVIIVTGWIINLEQEKIKEKGVDFTLKKPYSKKELDNVVSEAITLKADMISNLNVGENTV